MRHEVSLKPEVPLEHVDMAVTELQRAEVIRVVDAGMGKFLGDADVEVVYADGKYRGYRIVRILNVERYRGVGLLAGDIILQVNGQSIERDDQAFTVFQSLKTAPRLEVLYERDGQEMHLSLPIVGEIPAAPAETAPPPPTAPASEPKVPPAPEGKPTPKAKKP